MFDNVILEWITAVSWMKTANLEDSDADFNLLSSGCDTVGDKQGCNCHYNVIAQSLEWIEI